MLDNTSESALKKAAEPEHHILLTTHYEKRLRQRNLANLSNVVLVVATVIFVSEVILAWPR